MKLKHSQYQILHVFFGGGVFWCFGFFWFFFFARTQKEGIEQENEPEEDGEMAY